MCSKHIPYQFVRNGSSLGIAVRWYHPQPHTCSRATTAGRCHVPMGAQQSRPSRAPPTNTDKEMYERLIAIQQQLVAAHAGRADEATLTLTLGRGAAGDARGAHDSSARISPAASPANRRSSAPTATHKNPPPSAATLPTSLSPGACRPAAGAAADRSVLAADALSHGVR